MKIERGVVYNPTIHHEYFLLEKNRHPGHRQGHERNARPEGGSTADRRRGDRGIAAAVTVALAQWARPPTRGVRAAAALDASEREGVHAACHSMTAPRAIERAERARRQRGGRGSQGGRRKRRGGGDAVVGGVAAAVDDNGEDDDGIRRHQATINPVMATMAAVADDDDDGGQRRR